MIAEQIQNLESWTPPTRSRLSRSEDNIGDFYKWYHKINDVKIDGYYTRNNNIYPEFST